MERAGVTGGELECWLHSNLMHSKALLRASTDLEVQLEPLRCHMGSRNHLAGLFRKLESVQNSSIMHQVVIPPASWPIPGIAKYL